MLVRLSLRDFAIVEQAEIDFKTGFSALSGETGAGKSILLDALGLALGDRAEQGNVREGAARAEISAEFEIDGLFDQWLAEHDLQGDEGLLIARRVVDADGRSRAFVNGHPVTATQLRELGERLIDIHSQHATQRILKPEGQRELLDRFAGLGDAVASVAHDFNEWRAAEARLEAALGDQKIIGLERERLEWKLGELAQLKLAPGEWEELNQDQKRLAHAAALIEGAQSVVRALTDSEPSIESQIGQLLHKLRPLSVIDAGLADAIECLDSASIQLREASNACSDYAARIDLDPERLEQLERRISQVFGTARRMKLAPEALSEELRQTEERLAQLQEAGNVELLRARVGAAEQLFMQSAKRLSSQRQKIAVKFAQAVSKHLQHLGMKGSTFQIAIETALPARHGIDRIEFRLAGHAGSTPKPVSKVASGGELSRIGLAIAVEAAQANPLPTLIFDEADAGVGGAVAEVIGGLMRQLGESRQVLCVTHLPQVAARAHQQFSVRKVSDGQRSSSQVHPLSANDRVEEIARMLGGIAITSTTRKHARELLMNGGS